MNTLLNVTEKHSSFSVKKVKSIHEHWLTHVIRKHLVQAWTGHCAIAPQNNG